MLPVVLGSSLLPVVLGSSLLPVVSQALLPVVSQALLPAASQAGLFFLLPPWLSPWVLWDPFCRGLMQTTSAISACDGPCRPRASAVPYRQLIHPVPWRHVIHHQGWRIAIAFGFRADAAEGRH